MSIVELKKITLFGIAGQKGDVLRELQQLGCLHLVSLKEEVPAPDEGGHHGAEGAHAALKWLKDSPGQRRSLHHDDDFVVDRFVEQVLENQQRVRELGDQHDFITKRIRDLEPWGEFKLPGEGSLKGELLWFYIVPVSDLRMIVESGLVWEIVHRDNRLAYVVVVSIQEPPLGKMPVPRTHAGAKPLSQLRREQEELEIGLDELRAERARLTRWRALLEHNMNRAEDRAALDAAALITLDHAAKIFALRAWVPTTKVQALENFAREHRLALTVENPSPGDLPPTLLDNPAALAGGESLVGFYQTPGYRAWDPSLVVFFSFAAFFAMILADAGYGMLMGLLLVRYWKKLGTSATGSRMRTLFQWLVGGTIIYGVLVGSYFGVEPAEGSLLGHLRVLDMTDYQAMMKLSIVIGCAHLVLANALMAFHGQTSEQRRTPGGWATAIVGGLVLWLAAEDVGFDWPGILGGILTAGGLAWVVWFNRPKPVRTLAQAIMRVVGGVAALTRIPQIFGDVLSYMRLFALGLASASLAMTFNQLAMSAADAVPGLGLLIAILIIILGHTINFLLAIMSGVVHGLRLNVMEFLRWSVSEEGYPFRAFAKKEIVQ